jgi:hypothetical protein
LIRSEIFPIQILLKSRRGVWASWFVVFLGAGSLALGQSLQGLTAPQSPLPIKRSQDSSWISIEEILPQYDELDDLPLIEALIRDGHFHQAKTLIHEMKPGPEKTFREGLVLAREGQDKEAYEHFQEVENQALSVANRVWLKKEKATSAYALGLFNDCTRSWSQAVVLIRSQQDQQSQQRGNLSLTPAESLLWADCAERSGQMEEAYRILLTSSSFAVVDRRIDFLLKRGLGYEARRQVQSLLEKTNFPVEGLSLAEKFKGPDFEFLLEILKLRFPGHPQVLATFGQLSFQQGRISIAADAFQTASVSEPSYLRAAAEMQRALGRFQRAEWLGLQIADEESQLKFKVSLLLDQQKFAQLLSLSGPILRSSLVQDQETQYALFYSKFTLGQKDKAMIHLQFLKRADLLAKAQKLKRLQSATR